MLGFAICQNDLSLKSMFGGGDHSAKWIRPGSPFSICWIPRSRHLISAVLSSVPAVEVNTANGERLARCVGSRPASITSSATANNSSTTSKSTVKPCPDLGDADWIRHQLPSSCCAIIRPELTYVLNPYRSSKTGNRVNAISSAVVYSCATLSTCCGEPRSKRNSVSHQPISADSISVLPCCRAVLVSEYL